MDGAKYPTGDLQPGAAASSSCEVCKGQGEYFYPCPGCGGTADCLECGSRLGSFDCYCERPEMCPRCGGTRRLNWCECWDDNWIHLGDMWATDSVARSRTTPPRKGSWKKLKKAKSVIRLSLDFYPATNDTPPAYRPPRPRNNGGTE